MGIQINGTTDTITAIDGSMDVVGYVSEDGTISVKDHGAKGDGSTDDYSAITSAIAAAAGKTLVFPKGTYSVTQTIVFDQSDSIVRGVGDVTITMPDDVNRTWSVANVGKSTID